jgi:hypothetical protein
MAQEQSDLFCLKIKIDPFAEMENKTEPLTPCTGLFLSVLPENWQCTEDSTIEWSSDANCRFSQRSSTPLPLFTQSCSVKCSPYSPIPEEEIFPLALVEPEPEIIPEEKEPAVQQLVPAKPTPKKVRPKVRKAPKKVVAVPALEKPQEPEREIAAPEDQPVSVQAIPTTPSSDMSFLIFSISYVNSQNQKSSVETLDLDWNPTYYFKENWAARGQLGFHSRKVIYTDSSGNEIDTTTFPMVPIGGYLNYMYDWLLISGGGGAQYWFEPKDQKFYGFASLGLAYFFTKKTWLLERVFFNFDQVYSSSDPIDEYVLGVSFKF